MKTPACQTSRESIAEKTPNFHLVLCDLDLNVSDLFL